MNVTRDLLLALLLGLLYLGASTTEPRPELLITTDPGQVSSSGEASWYRDPRSPGGLYGAVHSYRFGDPRYRVEVCRADDRSVCVTVTVRDHMANPRRAIDLSPEAFSRLAPLSRGVVSVVVSRVGGAPRVTLPPTSTLPDGAP